MNPLIPALILGILFMSSSKKAEARGIRNNNPGNLIISANAWKGKIPVEKNTDGKFEQFEKPEYGIRALYIDLRSKINRGLNTIEKIISVYAPSNENNTQMYIAFVESNAGINRHKILTIDDIKYLVPAIIKMENGYIPYSENTFKTAYALV